MTRRHGGVPLAAAPAPAIGRVCDYCGDVFDRVRDDQRFCRPSCRAHARREKAAARQRPGVLLPGFQVQP